MRLTRAASYAIQAMAHLAGEKPKAPMPSHEIAAAHNIPERFLLKVLKPLVSAGLLDSIKGPHGGYRLARPPGQIKLLEIVEAVDGPIRGTTALPSGRGNAALERRLQVLCDQVAGLARRYLNGIRLSHLASAGRR